jgi:hypothetical protein
MTRILIYLNEFFFNLENKKNSLLIKEIAKEKKNKTITKFE